MSAGAHALVRRCTLTYQILTPFFLVGQIHKKQGDTDKALMHFSWAMDLDPKGVHTQIKESIDPSLPRAADAEGSPAEPDHPDLEQQEQNESDASF